MRKLIPFMLLLAVLWSGWWWLASQAIGMGLEAAQDDLERQGGALRVGSVAQEGFPFTLRTRAEGIELDHPDQPLRISLASLTLEAPTHWPGQARLSLPEEPIDVRLASELFRIVLREGLLSLDLRPAPSLDLKEAAIKAGPWQINSPRGNIASGRALDLRMKQSGQEATLYHLDLALPELSPGDLLRQSLQLPADVPRTFDSFTAALEVRFDQPLNRHSLRAAPSLPRVLVIEDMRIAWGALEITAAADLRVTDEGQPEGRFDVRIANWERLLELTRAVGLPSGQIDQAALFLRALAQRDGAPETLSLPLRFEGGQTYLDTIALGPAPILR